MLNRIMRFLGRESFENKVDRLARAALKEAIRLFESGDLAWTKGVLLANGGEHDVASYEAVTLATRGCALGGVGKAAWIVTGEPTPDNKEGWRLKEYVEAYAMDLAYEAAYDNTGNSVPAFNDTYADSFEDVRDKVLKPAIGGTQVSLPVSNRYHGGNPDDSFVRTATIDNDEHDDEYSDYDPYF